MLMNKTHTHTHTHTRTHTYTSQLSQDNMHTAGTPHVEKQKKRGKKSPGNTLTQSADIRRDRPVSGATSTCIAIAIAIAITIAPCHHTTTTTNTP